MCVLSLLQKNVATQMQCHNVRYCSQCKKRHFMLSLFGALVMQCNESLQLDWNAKDCLNRSDTFIQVNKGINKL